MWIVENAECKNITEIIYKRIRYIYICYLPAGRLQFFAIRTDP